MLAGAPRGIVKLLNFTAFLCLISTTAVAAQSAKEKQLSLALSFLNSTSSAYSAAAHNCGIENKETTKAELKSLYKRARSKENIEKMMGMFDIDYQIRTGHGFWAKKCNYDELKAALDQYTADKIEVYDLINDAGY